MRRWPGRTSEQPASKQSLALAVAAGCEEARKAAAADARSAPAMFAPPICRRSRRNASRSELILRKRSFRRIGRRRRLPTEHRCERSEPLDTASAASGAIKRVGSPAVVVSWQRNARRKLRLEGRSMRLLAHRGLSALRATVLAGVVAVTLVGPVCPGRPQCCGVRGYLEDHPAAAGRRC